MFLNVINAQVQLGASYGHDFDFGKNISSQYKSNTNFEINFTYKTQTIFHPSIAVLFTRIPLNYSDEVVRNQSDYKTVVINNATSLKLGLETVLKDLNKSNISAKLGVGVSFLSNPLVLVENSNESYGFNTTYVSEKSENNFAFIDLSTSINRRISDYWAINLDLGCQYYPKNNSITVLTRINGKEIEISSQFTELRPYGKIGLTYFFNK